MIVPKQRDIMRKREQFAVSLRKENKRLKLNDKRAKIGTKLRPGAVGGDSSQELLSYHPSLSDLTLAPVMSHLSLTILGGNPLLRATPTSHRDRSQT